MTTMTVRVPTISGGTWKSQIIEPSSRAGDLRRVSKRGELTHVESQTSSDTVGSASSPRRVPTPRHRWCKPLMRTASPRLRGRHAVALTHIHPGWR